MIVSQVVSELELVWLTWTTFVDCRPLVVHTIPM